MSRNHVLLARRRRRARRRKMERFREAYVGRVVRALAMEEAVAGLEELGVLPGLLGR